ALVVFLPRIGVATLSVVCLATLLEFFAGTARAWLVAFRSVLFNSFHSTDERSASGAATKRHQRLFCQRLRTIRSSATFQCQTACSRSFRSLDAPHCLPRTRNSKRDFILIFVNGYSNKSPMLVKSVPIADDGRWPVLVYKMICGTAIFQLV